MPARTDSRASEPVGSPERADETGAAAGVRSTGDRGKAVRFNAREAVAVDPADIEAIRLAVHGVLQPAIEKLDAAISRLEARYGKAAQR